MRHLPAPTQRRPVPDLHALRQELLRDTLPATVTLLKLRRAAEILPADIDDYVALNWLEWNGGSLQLTVTGRNVCSQVAGRAG